FESIARRDAKIVQKRCPVEHGQLAHGSRLDVDETPNSSAFEQRFRILAFEVEDRHARILTHDDSIVK
ncbi:hypothetical protein, partial [Nitrosomonas sp.]|uniref:hypothetical protein n=1 Tax=Nitrosomonas sp. TaxID=42353 RepID=UPI0025DAE9A8